MADALFDEAGSAAAARGDAGAAGGAARAQAHAPLAARVRPRTPEDLVGQQGLLGERGPLRLLLHSPDAPSAILWGPPGSGKTTIAHLVAATPGRTVVMLSALNATVKDLRAQIEAARHRRAAEDRLTVLFIDEVHRFSRTQQDALLAAVEARDVTLLAATTENPSFSVVAPLLSRCLLLVLQPLSDDDVRAVVRRAVAAPEGLGGAATVSPEAEDYLVRLAGGDARRALTYLETAWHSAADPAAVTLADVETAVDRAAPRYDRAGDQHYDIASALIKSIRGSDVDAALHWLARMLEAGEDPRFVARRLMILASEDVGMADSSALPLAVAAAQAVALVGMPEARLILGQAVIHLALAPKSNAVTVAVQQALADVRAGLGGEVPQSLRDSHSAAARGAGSGVGYRYPHDDARGVVRQDYLPAEVAEREYYRPTLRGAERGLAERLEALRTVIRGRMGRNRS